MSLGSLLLLGGESEGDEREKRDEDDGATHFLE